MPENNSYLDNNASLLGFWTSETDTYPLKYCLQKQLFIPWVFQCGAAVGLLNNWTSRLAGSLGMWGWALEGSYLNLWTLRNLWLKKSLPVSKKTFFFACVLLCKLQYWSLPQFLGFVGFKSPFHSETILIHPCIYLHLGKFLLFWCASWKGQNSFKSHLPAPWLLWALDQTSPLNP